MQTTTKHRLPLLSTSRPRPPMTVLRMRRLLWLLVCGIAALSVAAVRAEEAVTTAPALPLLDVAFCATPTAAVASRGSVFVSQARDCSVALATADVPCASEGSRAFNVTSASLGISLDSPVTTVPVLYWCVGSGSAANVGTLQMNVVQSTPMYYYMETKSTVTFSSATPVGSTVDFFALPDCTASITGSPVQLDSSRTVSFTSPISTVYVCADIPSSVSGAPRAMALRNTLVGGTAYDVSPTTGVRHATIEISTHVDTIFYYAFSTSPTCSDLPVPQASSANNGGNVTLTIDKPGGDYYFCGADTSKVYIPSSNKFSVEEYGVQPHSSYANVLTSMRLSLNATKVASMSMALFSNADCATGMVQSWRSSPTLWNVTSAGTLYACVRKAPSDVAYYANTFVVANLPSLSTAPAAAVAGLPLTVTLGGDVLGSAVYTVGVAVPSVGCSLLLASANASAAAASVQFSGLSAAAGALQLCVSNPITTAPSDSSEATAVVFTGVRELATRIFRLGYDALRVGASVRIALDTEAVLGTGTAVVFLPASPSNVSSVCDAVADGAGVVRAVSSDNALANVTFPSAGLWAMCAAQGTAYTLLRTVQVYSTTATLSVSVLMVGAAVRVRVTDIPEQAAVTLVRGTACGSPSAALATSVWPASGYAELSVTARAAGTHTVCVAYPSSSAAADTSAASAVMSAGTVAAAYATVYPSVAYVGETTTLRFAGIGSASLAGYVARLASGTDCSRVSSPATEVALAGPGADAQGVSHGTLSGSALASGTVYAVCVGMSSGATYSLAGTVAATVVPALTTDTVSGGEVAQGLPARVGLPLSFVAVTGVDTYVVVASGVDCTNGVAGATTYGRGSIDAATGATTAFVAPAASTGVTALRVCVAASARLVDNVFGYALAGTVTAARFHTSTTLVQLQRYNDVAGSPMSTQAGAQLSLARCSDDGCDAANADATCATTTLYHTSPTVAFAGAVGTYLVCQRVALGSAVYVVGSSTTLEAVEPYVATANATTLRAYIAIAVTLSGGPSGALGGHRVLTVQPAAVACGAAAAPTSQSVDVTDGLATVTITEVAGGQDVVFCLADAALVSVEVMRGYLLPYVLPAAVVDGAATTLTSGAPLSGASAKLSSSASCTDAVAGGAATLLEAGQATFTVDGCAATTSNLDAVYYCETRESGAYVSRGTVSVLRARNCSGGRPASIVPKYAAPGAAISDYGLAVGALANPRLSTSADCASLVDSRVATVGYAPALGESAVFYVCAEVVGGAALPLFTTAAPTLTVLNWAVSPSAALSRYNATMGVLPSTSMSVNYATPSSSTFFSTSRSCDTSLLTASALATAGGAAVYRTVGVSGLVYVCATDPLTSAATAVAAFLSVTPPSVVRAAPAIVRGASYTATLVVDGATPLYAMQPGADASYPYHAYYTSSNRSVFLSADGCATGIAGVATATADTSGRVSFGTSAISAGLGSVALCAETPARTAVVMAKVAVATGKVYPSQFTTGVWSAAIYIPAYANTVFSLSQSSGSCTATTGMPTFTTDGEGYGAVNLVSPQNGAALPTGTYTLCASVSSADLDVIDTIVVVDASFFGVRGTTFVVGVASTMELTDDLVSSYLYAGFSESRECTTMTSTYGTWATLTDASIEVSPTAVRTSGLYLCAQSPRNSSIVALPLAAAQTSTLMFAKSTIALPSGGWDACATYSMDQCYPPGSSAASSSSWLAMVHGECCSSARAVVGKSRMASGTCQLTMDYDAVASYGSSATFNLCVLDDADDAVCTTVASAVPVSTACTRPTKSGGLSRGVIAAIVVCSVVGGLAVIAGIIVLICCCCCRRGDAPKKGKEGELIVYHEYAEDDQHLVGYLVGGQHPLLYYPSGSQQGRSVSPSPPYPSTSSGGRSLVEEMEEEDRDQIALEEARGRYNVRLHFAEEVQRLEAEAKNAAVDAGLDATWASADSCLRGVARPERRCVESIVTEDDVASAFAADEPSVDVSLEDHETKTGRPRAVQAVPEEQDLNVTANADASRSAEAKSGRRKKLRSRSIESNPVPPLSPAESYLTNDDFEEQEESITESNSGVDGSVVAVAAAEAQTSPRRMGDVEEEAPRRRVVVRHFAHPSSVRTRQRHSSPRRETSRERPHLDPTQLTPSTAPGADTRALPVHHRAADVAGDEMNDSAVLARSPIASPEAQDLSEGALAVARMGNDVDAAAGDDDAPTRRACDSGSAEDDETDLLSFTTTQHFHDELRFVREQEDGRRQRLCNWEEEERAALAQAELNAYLALPTPADVHEDDDVASNSSATETAAATTAASHSSAATVARPSQRGDQQTEEASEARRDVPNDEETYHAPFVPATLPSLPPAPRPQTLLNDQNHVVDV